MSVLDSGTLLSFWTIYQGQSLKTCPFESAPDYENAKAAGFQFEYLKIKTYWSTHKIMHFLIQNILVPYFSEERAKLGLPESQKSILQIDVWLAHCLKEFQTWMKTHHLNIILDFVPNGTTGV